MFDTTRLLLFLYLELFELSSFQTRAVWRLFEPAGTGYQLDPMFDSVNLKEFS